MNHLDLILNPIIRNDHYDYGYAPLDPNINFVILVFYALCSTVYVRFMALKPSPTEVFYMFLIVVYVMA